MSEHLREWWGFRVRVPPDIQLTLGTRIECVIVFMMAAAAALALRLLLLGLRLGADAPVLPRIATETVSALVIVGVFLAIGIVVPLSLFNRSPAGPWMALSREKGSLGRADLAFILVTLGLLILGVFRIAEPGAPTAAVMLVNIAAIWSALAGQETIRLTARRWTFALPEWLKQRAGSDEDKKLDDVDRLIGPDTNAAPVYTLNCGDTTYSVGIAISATLLTRLRVINSSSGGALYQSSPDPVVLMDRPPVDGDGPNHMIRMSRQIASIVQRHHLSRYQIANLVLGFVQDAITYQFDEESTREFAGGPFLEYGRFPVETVHDRVGDCECTSLLCASLLSYLGFRTALIYVGVRQEDSSAESGHVAVGLDVDDLAEYSPTDPETTDIVTASDGSGRRFLYGETAVDGMRIAFGTIPGSWKTRLKVKSVQPVAKPA